MFNRSPDSPPPNDKKLVNIPLLYFQLINVNLTCFKVLRQMSRNGAKVMPNFQQFYLLLPRIFGNFLPLKRQAQTHTTILMRDDR